MRRALVLLLFVLASGCAAPEPPSNGGDGLATAEALAAEAHRAARAVDPTVRLVGVIADPADFLVVANGGRAPEWRFVFQMSVNPSDLEPDPVYGTAIANASTEQAVFQTEAPGFTPRARAPDARAWLPAEWRGSADAARALAAMGRATARGLALELDGCPTPTGAPGPAWVARAVTGRVVDGAAVSAAAGEACRAWSEPAESASAFLAVESVDADLERGGPAVERAVRSAAGNATVALAATSVPGWDGALARGLNATFEPAALDPGGESVLRVTAAADALPGKYTIYVHGRDEAGRPTAGLALVLRVR